MLFCCLLRDPSSGARPGVLAAVARAWSPRVDPVNDDAVIFDAGGLARAVGSPETIAQEVIRLAMAQGMTVRIAMARTITAAWVLAHARGGVTVVVSGAEPNALASLPLRWLDTLADLDGRPSAQRRGHGAADSTRLVAVRRHLALAYAERCATLARWGLDTFGDLARLARADVHARLGLSGVRLHQAAHGEDVQPLIPVADAPRFAERIELDWPIDGLEPLAFVVARQADVLCVALERSDCGAITVTTSLGLVTRETHTRVLQLPAPMRDPAVLRTLVLLDLETHPPSAAIDVIEIVVDPAPGRIVQGSLLDRSTASPEQLAPLVARLGALMGATRIGRPVLLDTDDTRAVGMAPWTIADSVLVSPDGPSCPGRLCPPATLRRFRLPLTARVTVAHGAPVRVVPSVRGLTGGEVVARAGPWRTSGRWWADDQSAWDRDEWDLELADGVVYRLARDRTTGIWVIEGLLD